MHVRSILRIVCVVFAVHVSVAGDYVFERTAGAVWQDGLYIGNGSHGVLAYAPAHLEWVVNKNDVFDRRVSGCDYVPHKDVMEYVRTNAVKSVLFLRDREKRDESGKTADGLTSSITPAVLRMRFWDGVGWSAPSVPRTDQRIDMMRGELTESMRSPALTPQVTTIVPRGSDVVAMRLCNPSNPGLRAIAEITRPEDPRLESPPAFEIDGDVVSFEQRLPYGDSYAVAIGATGKGEVAHRGMVARLRGDCRRDFFLAVRRTRKDAIAAVRSAAKTGFDALREENAAWWRDFWTQGATAEFSSEPDVDRNWKYSLFALAGQFGAVPMPALNGLVYGPLDAGVAGVGSNCYVHDQNVQIPVLPFFPLNHCGFVRIFASTYAACMDELKRRTKEVFGASAEGAYLPLNMNPEGVEHPIRHYRYTLCGGAYSGLVLAKAWQHSRDPELMKDIYPVLREFIRFYTSTMTRDKDGTCHFIWSVPPEIFTGSRDELAVVACLKPCLEVAIEGAAILKTDAQEAALWKDILAHYPRFAKQSGGGWWGGPEIPDDHYMYGGHLFYPFFPAESNLDRDTAEKTLAYTWTNAVEIAWTTDEPHPNHEWSAFYTGTARMRLHDPSDGWKSMTDFLAWFGKPNGLFSHNPVIVTDMTREKMLANKRRVPPRRLRGADGRISEWGRGEGLDLTANREAKRLVCPVLEGGAAFLHLATESLLQSWEDEIRLFPCVPPGFTGRFSRFRAKGGYVVSAEMKNGRVVDFSVEGVGEKDAVKVTCPTDPEFVQLPGEPEWKAPIPAFAFPDALSAFVFRNWGLVEPDTMARTVGASREDIVKIATEMGLAADVKVSPLWKTLGYVTILRRNWHLLPYPQLMELTGLSRHQLRSALMEDDFLGTKLGIPRPKCPPIRFSKALADNGRPARLEIKDTLAKANALPGNTEEEPRFAFLDRFGSLAPLSSGGDARFDLRMIYPFSADYGDILAGDPLVSCPEGLIADLSARGVNAIWMHAVLSELTTDPAYPEFGADAPRRLVHLRRLVDCGKRHGVKVILYLNEPRTQPAAFFEKPGRAALRGSSRNRGGVPYYCLCTQNPETLRWLRDATEQLFRNVPGLGGVFTITMSENGTHCASQMHRNNTCKRCKDRPYAEFIVEINKAIFDGVKAADPSAVVIFYDTAWPDGADKSVIPRLPKGGRIVAWSEKLMPFRQAGLELKVNEYSISKPGPGPLALSQWAAARKAGLKTDAKLQVNTSWEICAVPYLPAMDLVAEHARNLSVADVDGVMLSWSLGGYPSPNLALFSRIRRGGGQEEALDALAADLYGAAAAKSVRTAWARYSAAFRNYPMQWQTVYYSPVQMGPANLLYPEKTGWRATMVNTAYDDYERWTAGFAKCREKWVELMDATAAGFEAGDVLWGKAVAAMEGRARETAAYEQRIFRAATLHFRSATDQAKFILARDKGDSVGMRMVAERELATAREMLSLVCRESVLGYESSNRYMYVPNDFREKILVCRRILRASPAGSSRGIIAEFLAKSAEERAAILADPVQKAKFKDVKPRPEDGPPRFMAVDKVSNMRDIGGWIGLDGRRVRHGLVYRSSAFNSGARFQREAKRGYEYIFGLTPVTEKEKSSFKPGERKISDKGIAELVYGLGIRSDLDLRSPHECYGMNGSPLGLGVKWFHCPQKTYGEFKYEDAKRAFAAAFRVFLDKSNYPVIFHCAGGADRTGAIAFILNGILGVSLDDLSKDWELTAFGTGHSVNPDFTHKTRFNRLVAVVDAYPGATLTERIVSYVKSCGFTDADIDRVREIMLEPKERNSSVDR